MIGSEALSLPDWLHLALAIVDALEQVHAGNVIHKDINPSNIIWNRDDGRLKLIDFGIATRLSREHPIIRSPKVLEGTLAYLAPEQTGRMNADIDYRADFYSLGASLYELMTGRRPFPSSDALELVHCHIAQRPPPPDQLTGSRVGHSVSEARGYFVSGKFDQLLAQTRKQEQSEHVLELVDQLNRGHRLITDSGERLHLAQMNLEAGRRAKHSTAYAAAVEYLQKGLNLLPGQHWEAYYELSMALHHEMIIASFLSGAHEASRDWARVTLEHAHSNLERAEIHRLVAGQQTMMAQYVDALDTVRRALGLLGIELPDGELWKAVHAEFASTRQSLGDTPIAELPHRPTISDPQVLTITRLLLKGLSAAFYVDHLLLLDGDDGLRVQAEASVEADGDGHALNVEVLQDLPLADCTTIAHGVVNYALRIGDSVILELDRQLEHSRDYLDHTRRALGEREHEANSDELTGLFNPEHDHPRNCGAPRYNPNPAKPEPQKAPPHGHPNRLRVSASGLPEFNRGTSPDELRT